ncbi:carbon-nitrogen hydrolase family protein [Roseibium sediminicola]|uniref:Carbon-nitrogen hydrolase family protein n=1 Tax=Roseibium sediminicola TaxID=2933272 RepID=A0ABT0GSX1_9HYPH|nr:carbon-nitrogen hydrolase family protein [Roseibium sp. CAU 1639]MCK7612527.1 carbon-nitrogen hydrolase family protein [Roseibium sp. CAU 1639]
MASFTAACVQLRSGKSVSRNAETAEALIRAAAQDGAEYVQTPEMSNVLVKSREELLERISVADDDPFLKMARALAPELGIHLHLGSIAVQAGGGKVANRAFLIAPNGSIAATYDKIHMFDVDLPNGESWRESATYAPGTRTVIADLPFARIGMAVCYDIRFPAIFRTQARQGAEVLTGPAAFTRQTGEAHWHVLQRARAIENGAYVISAAQGGTHEDGRETYGHSLVVNPWGKVVAELDGDEPGYVLADIEPDEVAKARGRIPAIANEREFVCEVADGLKEIPA